MKTLKVYPKITIITVVYNSVKTLEQTILSVINQTYENIEYIIIDGGSTDGTIDIIKKYEEQIFYWVSEPDNGIYDAMNKGIDVATGDYIQFLNADDCLVNKEIIKIVKSELNDRVEILSAPIWVVEEQYQMQYLLENKVTKEMILSGEMIPHPGLFVKTNIMNHYLFNTEYKISSDYEFVLKCILDNRKIKYIDIPVVFFSNMGVSMKQRNICIDEHKDIFTKYDISQKYIKKFLKKNMKQTRKSNFKELAKKIVKMINSYKFILFIKGWQVHKCSNCLCRWCNRIDY